MKKQFNLLPVFCLLLIGNLAIAQQDSTATKGSVPKKEMSAVFTQAPPDIDGNLDEPAWQTATPTTDFMQLQPNPGKASAQRSEVRILYNNEGIYIGAQLFDTQPDSIMQELTERDDLGNTDWFGIFIDSYRDGINGFGFIVTPGNVQFDAKYSTFGEDPSWDGVWKNRAQRNAQGWSLEIFLPYSVLRFPKEEVQTWHVNFGRFIARTQEKSFWNNINPQVDGFLNQAGLLNGIANINAPLRLQATPFLAVYGLHHRDVASNPVNTYGRSINGGMDVKIGLSNAFTLDMTLIPDFSEAQSDNQVLNLSPFEVQFNENRPFFTEGTELFSKGDLFYSRRVGGTPLDYYAIYDQYEEDAIISNPSSTQLLNATKISGRTSKGLGIGWFNATSGRTYARVRDSELGEMDVLTNPLSNYSVLVLDQNLPNNSYATLINTTVLREGHYYDANVTGTDFLLRNKANSYAIGGTVSLSQLYNTTGTDLGHAAYLRLRKTSGNVQAGLSYTEESDTYDPNDLGFLYNNNERSFSGFVEYNKYESFGRFNRGGVGFFAEYNMLYNPSTYTEWGMNAWAWAQSKQFWQYNVWTYINPTGTYDYFEPRTTGRVWHYAGGGNMGMNINSDSRKRLQGFVSSNYWTSFEKGWFNIYSSLGLRFRYSDKFNFSANVDKIFNKNGTGYVNDIYKPAIDPETGAATEVHEIYLGRRNRNTVELGLRANYTFNANMTLSFRMRHYWSKVTYNSFHLLSKDGDLTHTDYNDNHDNDFDAFNIDLIYRWRFAPGSDIFVVWKNSLFSFEEMTSPSYFRNFNGLFGEPQDNQLSLKVVYFLDYANFQQRI